MPPTRVSPPTPWVTQATARYDGAATVLEAKGRHDPCVLPRASPLGEEGAELLRCGCAAPATPAASPSPPAVEAMTALVLADMALVQRSRGAELRCLPLASDDYSEGGPECF